MRDFILIKDRLSAFLTRLEDNRTSAQGAHIIGLVAVDVELALTLQVIYR